MLILYDADTDTYQIRTRRWERDRHMYRVHVPAWPRVTWLDGMPDWLFGTALDNDNGDGTAWEDAYDALGIPRVSDPTF